ncbi:MAG: radical SAM protein [bacterium]|nr:radical SAM protein [bacterium]
MTNMLRVNEIFVSIQGESTYAGQLCGIIRLSGCNLRCRYCDTRYAYDDYFLATVDEICNQIGQYQTPLLLLTGGEPLLQEESYELMDRLSCLGHTVLLETNGSIDISRVPSGVVKIVDIKCPGSGESQQICWKNLERLAPSDEVKFVISNQEDLEWATQIVAHYQLGKVCRVLFSPAFGWIKPSTLAEWIINHHLPVRLQLQLHKIIWGKEARGR